MPVSEAPLNRDTVAEALSAMAFRTIDPGRSLNLDYGIFGDEAESMLERVRALYGVDPDLFWSKVEFDKYFDPETNWLSFPLWVALWLLSLPLSALGMAKSREDEREPFTVDRLVDLLQTCRASAPALPERVGAPVRDR